MASVPFGVAIVGRAFAFAFVLVLVGGAATGCGTRSLLEVESCPDAGVPPCGSVSPGPQLSRGLVGLWHFDDVSGSVTAHDSSGQGNDGTLVMLDPTTAWITAGGVSGGALEIGAAGYVEVRHSPSIDSVVSETTVSAWIYLEMSIVDVWATAASRQIGTGVQQDYHISLNHAGHPNVFISPTVPVAMSFMTPAPTVTPPLKWTHLAATYDGALAAFYVDGELIASMPLTGTFAPEMTPLILGGNGNNSEVTERFPGRIDEIALYNRGLSAEEIKELAKATLALYSGPAGSTDAGAASQDAEVTDGAPIN